MPIGLVRLANSRRGYWRQVLFWPSIPGDPEWAAAGGVAVGRADEAVSGGVARVAHGDLGEIQLSAGQIKLVRIIALAKA